MPPCLVLLIGALVCCERGMLDRVVSGCVRVARLGLLSIQGMASPVQERPQIYLLFNPTRL